MDYASLRRAHDDWLGFLEGSRGVAAVARRNSLLHLPHHCAQKRAPALVDLGTARDFASSFAGGTGVGHCFSSSGAERRLIGPIAPMVNAAGPVQAARGELAARLRMSSYAFAISLRAVSAYATRGGCTRAQCASL